MTSAKQSGLSTWPFVSQGKPFCVSFFLCPWFASMAAFLSALWPSPSSFCSSLPSMATFSLPSAVVPLFFLQGAKYQRNYEYRDNIFASKYVNSMSSEAVKYQGTTVITSICFPAIIFTLISRFRCFWVMTSNIHNMNHKINI